jgi:hypothetical protein
VAGRSVARMSMRMSHCHGCGKALSKRTQKIFCSNACQKSMERDIATKRWLESGEACMSGRRVHYIRQFLADAQSGCCAMCGGANAWLGQPLALVLDHIDETRRTTNGKTCGWSIRTVTRNCRRTRVGIVAAGDTTGDSDTPTASRIRESGRGIVGVLARKGAP